MGPRSTGHWGLYLVGRVRRKRSAALDKSEREWLTLALLHGLSVSSGLPKENGVSDQASVQVTSMTLAAERFHADPFPPLARAGRSRVYPYPMQDDLTDEMGERDFTAVVLDNGLLRVTVLPELGGHVLSLRDLVHEREVFYDNVPLKFGLIAMRGAWWAGGIEWNFPQVGHNVITSDTVSWHTREGDDGSATVCVGTVERLTRMAWTVAITLRPDDWRMHVDIWTFNRTPFAHRCYFWSNAAVPARDDFRFLLPATQVYSWWYGADGAASFPISKGRDISRYTAHQRSADLFAKDLRADWFGCYYDGQGCGVLHHASRFDVHGRKLFTWGNADDGKVWAELLNARGEPYVEIQAGHFVHQGIHRLMAPHYVEAWHESWAPIWDIGGVLHATDALALNAAADDGTLTLRLLALVPLPGARLAARQGDRVVEQADLDFASGEIKSVPVALADESPVTVEVCDGRHEALRVTLHVEGGAVRAALDAIPPHTAVPDKPAQGPPATPHAWLLDARGHEEHNELDAAADSYRKALDLDPLCVPAMAGLAQWHLKRAETAKARDWARKALQADPQNEDALWWHSVADFLEPGKGEQAAAHLSALRRSPRYCGNALVLFGELALRRNEPAAALGHLELAAQHGQHDSRTLALAALAARLAGRTQRAHDLLDAAEHVNPLEPLLWSERHFAGDSESAEAATTADRVFGADTQMALEAACDYERLGVWAAADAWLRAAAGRWPDAVACPMLLYHRAHALWQLGRIDEAMAAAREASQQSPLFAFPHRYEDGLALGTALRLCPDDTLAQALLGTWLASLGRWDEALGHWTRVTQRVADGELAVITWRNIGLAKWHKQHNADEALKAYDAAIEALRSVPDSPPLVDSAWRLWLDRDAILAAQGRHADRVAAFGGASEAVQGKFQVLARWTEACLRVGRPQEAIATLSRCHFKPWEGEMRSRHLWKDAHMQLGHKAKEAGDLATARQHFEAAADYPRHLNVGRPAMTDNADALFWAGWCALQGGDSDAARGLLAHAADEQQPTNASTAEFKTRAADLLRSLGGDAR